MLLVLGRGEMAVLPAVSAVMLYHSAMETCTDCNAVSTGKRGIGCSAAVTAVLLHHSVVDIWTDCNAISTWKRGNGGSACSYCSTVTSQCYGYMD